MPNIDDIIEQLLNDRRLKEGAAFSSRTYSDQPLIERGSDLKARMERRDKERAERRQREAERRRRRAQRKASPTPEGNRQRNPYASQNPLAYAAQQAFDMMTNQVFSPVPERIREMRRLEKGGAPLSLSYGSSAAAALFYAQGTLMADYEDDYEFHGSFNQYYPTYAAMTDHQLRGYFAWRSYVRAGTVDTAPLSFAFVYVYELINGIGTTPGAMALSELRAFGEAFQAADPVHGSQLLNYLRRWLMDYAVYHDIKDALQAVGDNPLRTAVLTLQRAEHAHLRAQKRQPRIDNAAANGESPMASELFQALGSAASYHICDSRLAKEDPALVSQVCERVFNALVMHCSKRRKTDFVEGLFGYAVRVPYTMFSAAVFYEQERHPDCTVSLGAQEQFICKDGRWWHLLASDARERNSELGLILHTVDFELRQRLAYNYPLKERKAPKYLKKIVRDAIDACLAEREEAERRRIVIDRSKLSGIRAAAAVTQEALLTDEERDIAQAEAPQPPSPPAPQAMPAEVRDEAPAKSITTISPAATSFAVPKQADQPNPAGLTPLESHLLQGLMAGTPATELLSPTDPFASVVVDSINEKLFDLIGDACIEFDGDEPRIIEDYLDDIREVLAG